MASLEFNNLSGGWLSLVERAVRDREVGGSNRAMAGNYLLHSSTRGSRLRARVSFPCLREAQKELDDKREAMR